jgi:UDP-3-O-[3-hydroxymyristoyl] N-acetylglucosamine deacetylase
MTNSNEIKQKTVASEIEFSGITLHKGNEVKIKLAPAPENHGIEFIRTDLKKNISNSIKILPENVVNTKMATVIGTKDFQISTTEHFLSSVYAMGIDNLKVYIDSNELPILDGSTIKFLEKLEKAGIKEQNKNKKFLKILQKVEVRDEKNKNRFVALEPHQSLNTVFDYTIDFEHEAIGVQSAKVTLINDNYSDFKENIASARTFGFLSEVEYLRANNLALGASYDNVIVIGEKNVLNQDGLRCPNEFARHKTLDAIGDMSFLNARFIGKYSSFAGSHHLNNLLIKKLLSDSKNYEII